MKAPLKDIPITWMLSTVNIQHDILETTIKEINLSRPHNANATLILDEMKIKCGLVYSASSGQLIGFRRNSHVGPWSDTTALRIPLQVWRLSEGL